jgi:hypothetical protein
VIPGTCHRGVVVHILAPEVKNHATTIDRFGRRSLQSNGETGTEAGCKVEEKELLKSEDSRRESRSALNAPRYNQHRQSGDAGLERVSVNRRRTLST